MRRSQVRETCQIGHIILVYAISQSRSRAVHQNPGHGLHGNVQHVVANPSTVGKSGQVTAENTEPMLVLGRGGCVDPHVQAQHLAWSHIGGLVESRNSGQKYLYQVIARRGRNLDAEKAG